MGEVLASEDVKCAQCSAGGEVQGMNVLKTRGVISLKGQPLKTSQRRWNLISADKQMQFRVGGTNFPGGGFHVHQGTKFPCSGFLGAGSSQYESGSDHHNGG